ncbi:MAG: response regulator [Myxococcales bacterium]
MAERNPTKPESIAVDPASLAQLQKLAELGLMTAAVLHEIRQPVSGIKGYAQMLRDGCPAPDEKIASLLGQVQRLEEMIETHRRFLNPTAQPGARADLCEVVRSVVRMLEPKARRSGVALSTTLPNAPVEVAGVPNQLMQITSNLVDNAIDAQAAAKRSDAPPVQVVVRAGEVPELLVGDAGLGISPEASRKLFTAFFTSKGPETGTGLGLFVSRRLAEANGARLEHVHAQEAQLKAVTVFRLRFGGGKSAKPGTKGRVLVVDDEEVVRTLLASLLEPDGLEVVGAATGDEGIKLVHEGHFDLVITDKNLPGAGGLEIARAVRERNPDCPVMLITGYASLETAQEALALGAVEYLEKPFDDIAEVRRRVREVLSATPPALEPAEADAARNVVVVCAPASANRVAEAVTLAGGDPVIVHSTRDAIPIVGPETAGVVLGMDLKGETLTADLARALRGGRSVPLVLVSETLSLKDTIVAIHMGAAACLSSRSSRPELARELAKALRFGPA